MAIFEGQYQFTPLYMILLGIYSQYNANDTIKSFNLKETALTLTFDLEGGLQGRRFWSH